MMYAALINGTMSHVLDYDDAHSVVRTHPSAPLVPALLSVAEHRALSGRQLITALIAGLEATIRIGYALGRGYYEKGWHATSVLGRVGTAAGVAGLLDLTYRADISCPGHCRNTSGWRERRLWYNVQVVPRREGVCGWTAVGPACDERFFRSPDSA